MKNSEIISRGLQEYIRENPTEDFPIPDISVVTNLREKAIKAYRDFGYPSDYINGIDKNRASWKTTVALTIANKTMGLPPKIIISEAKWRRDTIYHELTHVSDFHGYCLRHNYLDMTYLEFLELEEFQSVYLMSEFRAFYRCALKGYEDLTKRVMHEKATYNKRLEQAIRTQQLETYYYYNVSFMGYLCAFYEQNVPEANMDELLNVDTQDNIHKLLKFLYRLQKKPFQELENYFEDLKTILDGFIDKA